MMLFICAVFFFPLCGGFLLPVNNTGWSSQGGNSLTDEHYVHLMGLVSVDRQNMAKMEQFVLQLQNDMNTMKQQISGQNQNNIGFISNQEIIALKNESDSLKQTIVKLQDGYQSMQKELNQVKTDNEVLKQDNLQLKQGNIQLKQEITQLKQGNTELNGVYLQSEIVTNRNNTMQLQTEVNTYGNEILNLKKELDVFTKSACNNASILQQNIQLLNNKTDKMRTDMNTLTSNSKARGQDFVALLQEMNTAKQEICNLETENKQISSDLQNYKTNTTTRIDDLLQRANKTVALTGHFPGGTVASSIVKFSSIITAIGISDINGFKQSGMFTSEVAGVYLFSVMISTRSGHHDGFYMYKNSTSLGLVYIHNSYTGSRDMNTGTGIVAVSLNVGDTLYVQGYNSITTNSNMNTLTIVKIS